MPEIILLIDGMYLTFSSFYANREMRTLSGQPTGAVFGFVTRIEYLIRELKPQRILVAFDSKEKTFRHELYKGYKAKRLMPPEEMLQQLPQIKEYIQLRGMDKVEIPGLEADDIIAVLSRTEQEKDRDIYIFSADKDLFQLVGDKVFVFHPKLKKKLDMNGVKEMIGVFPEQIVDFLSLTGDSSDNIPGVPGIGEKTAKQLIEKFGNLEKILKELESIEGKAKEKIKTNLDLLHLSRKLLDLSQIPDFDQKPDLKKFANKIDPRLVDFYRRLSFNSLLRDIEDSSQKSAVELNIHYNIVKNRSELKELKNKIIKEGHFSFDCETTGINFFDSRIVGISFAFSDEGYYVPFLFPGKPGLSIDLDFGGFQKEMGDIFANPEIKKSGHNLKFDILHLKHNGIVVNGIAHDSMLMAYLLYPNRRAHNLKELTAEILNFRQIDYKDLTGRGKQQIGLDEVPIEKISKYCIDDSFLSLKLIGILEKRLEKKGVNDLYRKIEIPLIRVLQEMEFTGVRIDTDFLNQASERLEKKIREVEEEIYTMAGIQFNINSSQQLGELLFEKMHLPFTKRTRKTKSYSTDIDVLNELKGFPLVEKIMDYRSYKKMLSTYLIGLMRNCDQNHRVHTSFNQTVTATGRLSSSNPNLQNIPVGELGGINIRKGFVAQDNGYSLLSTDYSQIELRVMAHFSQDPGLMEAFAQGMDVHQHTADTVFARNSSLNYQEKRRRAKIINFSILYGSGPYSLSKELGISFGEAKDFIDRYYQKYSGVKDFIDRSVNQAEKNPEVQTIAGRKREIPEILSSNRTVKENGKRMVINSIIQGSAADIIKIAMVKIFGNLEKMESRLILQVHDELVFEYPDREEPELLSMIQDCMENAIQLRVPLLVSMKKGRNWGEMAALDQTRIIAD